jgi:hypothetical protein
MVRTLTTLALLALAAPALASDGRGEIDQACALAGCFTNDSPGFPVNVVSGSYVLTSDLVVPDANTTAIIGTSDVTIDLNGFSIVGPTSCTGAPAACTNTGSGKGINASARLTVRNGAIRRMGDDAITTSTGLVAENLLIAENGGDGIAASDRGHQILHCRIFQNGGSGISMYYGNSEGSLIQGNTLYGNGSYGAQLVGATVLDNAATYNGDEGLYLANGSLTHGNRAAQNNGGNANPQINGGVNGGANVCGTAACP